MGDWRAKIASRIDGIPGGTAKRKADRPDEAPNKIWSKPCRGTVLRYGLCEDCADDEHENESADNLADEVGGDVTNRWRGAKDRQLQRGVWGFLPVRQIVQPNKSCAHKIAQQLGRNKRNELGVIAGGNSESERDGRIEKSVLAPASNRSEHTCHHREGPARGNDDPARCLTF